MVANTPEEELFKIAIKEFQSSLKDKSRYNFARFHKISDVYDETDKIQKGHGLQNLKRIQPYLQRLQEFAGVIEVFVSVKPDLLGLLWGPVKFILQVTCTHIKSFEKIISTLETLGDCLPQFNIYNNLFKGNPRVSHLLCLFYRDVLDFYAICLNFFQIKNWKAVFEALWPARSEKITLIRDNIERHKLLFSSEITLASITDAYAARASSLKEYETSQKHREREQLEYLKQSLNPRLYDDRLESIRENHCRNTTDWLFDEDAIQSWLSTDASLSPILWLRGIPGAGKTHISAALISELVQAGGDTAFAFLSYQERDLHHTITILHSFMFQLIHSNSALQTILQNAYDTGYRKLRSSLDFCKDLFCDMLKTLGSVHTVLDGLDEIAEIERKSVLKTFLEISSACPNLKILVSSRPEADIVKLLGPKTQVLSIGRKNTSDINAYVNLMIEDWLDTVELDPANSKQVKDLVQPVATKAAGMFLYARLVMTNLMSQPSLEEFKKEAAVLPDGLQEAYGRIVSRIDKKLSRKERLEAKNILRWIACSKVPLRRQEIQQALSIREGDKTIYPERKTFRNFVQLCGPIIESHNEYLIFVHFTVKEYLCGPQSGYFIDEAAANRQIALTCMWYLELDCFWHKLRTSKISENLLRGDYILLSYAESYWLQHVKQGVHQLSRTPSIEDLCPTIVRFLEIQGTPNLRNLIFKASFSRSRLFDHFQEHWPELVVSLSVIDGVRKQNEAEPGLVKGEPHTNESLLALDEHVTYVQACREAMTCPKIDHKHGCRCATLKEHYGNNLFKCHKKNCTFSRLGFELKAARDRHEKLHERLFKCPIVTCDFAQLGFVSETKLRHHKNICHLQEGLMDRGLLALIELDNEDIVNALIDSVDMGRADYVRLLIGKAQTPPWLIITEKALRGSSPEVLELCVNARAKAEKITKAQLLNSSMPPFSSWYAIENGSIDVIEWLLDNGVDGRVTDWGINQSPHFQYDDKRTPLEKAAGYYRPDVVHLLLARYPDLDATEAMRILIRGQYHHSEARRGAFIADARETARLLVERGVDIDKVPLTLLSLGLCDVEIGELLMDIGADANLKVSGYTPLYLAVKKANGSRLAAEFAKFLMDNGANPHTSCGNARELYCHKLYGAKKIKKYLGISWDELVKQTRSARLSSSGGKLLAPLGSRRRPPSGSAASSFSGENNDVRGGESHRSKKRRTVSD